MLLPRCYVPPLHLRSNLLQELHPRRIVAIHSIGRGLPNVALHAANGLIIEIRKQRENKVTDQLRHISTAPQTISDGACYKAAEIMIGKINIWFFVRTHIPPTIERMFVL